MPSHGWVVRPLGDEVLAPALTGIVLKIRETMQSASGGLDEAAVGVAAGLASALGAALGLIILPTWMLTVISDQRRGQAVLNRRLAPWLRADFWAVARIADRIASTYIRGFLVIGVVVGVLTYLGVRLSQEAGGPVFQEPLALAVFAGATQLVPEIGPFIGFLPALLLLPVAPERAAVYLAVYLGARWLGAGMVGGRLLERRLGVHPALLIPSIVILTQFGWIWLFIAAPVCHGGRHDGEPCATSTGGCRSRRGPPACCRGIPLHGPPRRARAAGRRRVRTCRPSIDR